MPAETTAMDSAPTVKAPARERFLGGGVDGALVRLLGRAAVGVVGLAVALLLRLWLLVSRSASRTAAAAAAGAGSR